jgi:hypothetical protein
MVGMTMGVMGTTTPAIQKTTSKTNKKKVTKDREVNTKAIQKKYQTK